MSDEPDGSIPAIHYVRWSSDPQEEGDSERRQTSRYLRFLRDHPEAYEYKALSLLDRGVRAFQGAHRKDPRNAMAQFLELVRAKKVPVPCYLVVDNLDRLSREHPFDSLRWVLDLIANGVLVVWAGRKEVVFDRKMDEQKLMLMLSELSRAHGESETKSDLVGAAWSEKKRLARDGVPHGKRVPAWIELHEGKYRLRPGAGEAVRLIFRLASEGQGILSICQVLNSKKVKPLGRSGRWAKSYVARILASRAALGEYQPCKGSGARVPEGEPIPNYFPAVVTETEWLAAQQAKATRKRRCGRPRSGGRGEWVFSGLVTCALDGSPYHIHRGRTGDDIVSAGLAQGWSGAVRGGFNLDVFTNAVLGKLSELQSAELFAAPSAGRVAELKARLADADRKTAVARRHWDADPESAIWQDALTAADREMRQIKSDLRNAQLEAASPALYAWDDFLRLVQENEPARLRAAILSTVDDVRLLVVPCWHHRLAAVQVRFKESGAVRDYLILHRAGRGRHAKRDARPPVAIHLKEVVEDRLDLRDINDAKTLYSILAVLDVSAL